MKSKTTRPRSNSREALIERINQDETYLRTVKRVNNLMKPLSVADLHSEVTNLHSSRLVRSILVNDVFADQRRKIIEASLQNQSYRSRLVEIKTQIMRVLIDVQEACTKCKKHIGYQYFEAIAAVVRTQADRNSLVDMFFSSVDRKSAELEGLMAIINVIVEDIDQAGWSIKRISDLVAEKHEERFHK